MSLDLVDLDADSTSTTLSPAILGASLSDSGNAQRLVALYGDQIRYLAAAESWLIWDGRRWQADETGEIWRLAKSTALTIYQEASVALEDGDRKRVANHALRSESETKLRSMISLARWEPGVAVKLDDLNADPFLLTVGNGTLDLRTGELRPPDRRDLITKGTEIDYEPEAECPTWLRFLEEIYAGDQELIDFDQRWIGYTLTGSTKEHAVRIDHGPLGRNGKSVHAKIQTALLGEYVQTAAFQTFLRTRSDQVREDLARLAGARLVIANEAGKGRRLDEATVKTLSGGDRVTARHLYRDSFEFTPTYKIQLVTNDRPRIEGGDEAIWSRLREVPYAVSFRGREDRELSTKLEAELPGILAWAVQGCLAWQESGLGSAAAIEEATNQYRADEDLLGAFIEECLETEGRIEVAELRRLYEAYVEEAGEQPLNGSRLGRELSHRGISRGGKARRYYVGLSAKGGGSR